MRVEQLSSSGYDIEADRPREECGVFGLYLPNTEPEIVERMVFQGELDNQHRGEESAGIAVADGDQVHEPFKRMGKVIQVFEAYRLLLYRPSPKFAIIGHNRYSTRGSSCEQNASPYRAYDDKLGHIAVGHNGNLVNDEELRRELKEQGVEFQGTTDSEAIAWLIAKSPGEKWEDKIKHALERCEGSFSLCMLTKDALWAARDNMGNRPLFWTSFHWNGGATGYAISSETPAFRQFGSHNVNEIHRGEILKIGRDGPTYWPYGTQIDEAFCGLEIAYLLRPDGRIRRGVQVDQIRRHIGKVLAQKYPLPEDVEFATYIPESSRSITEAAAETLGLPVRTSMIKGRYGALEGGAVRGFISPSDDARGVIASSNYFPFDWVIGKKLGLFDDSIIRGKTTDGVLDMLKKKVGFLLNCGAREIHLRIPWPPVKGFCPLGTDINQKDRLIFVEVGEDIAALARHLGVASLAFLTPEEYQDGVDEAIGEHVGLCMGCTTGKYPVDHFNADKTLHEKC